MKTLFSIFVLSVLSSLAFAGGDICLRPDGCHIDTTTWECTECVSKEFAPPPVSCLEKELDCEKFYGVGTYYCSVVFSECVAFDRDLEYIIERKKARNRG